MKWQVIKVAGHSIVYSKSKDRRITAEEVMEHIAELEAEVKDKVAGGIFGMSWLTERIAGLEADCADMAEDIMAEAAARHSDGRGGIHPALTRKYQRDISTASKYIKDKAVDDKS